MSVLVTGGSGYIGSHTCVELIKAGYDVVVIDNLSNSDIESINRVEKIAGGKIKFYENDLLNKESIDRVFNAENIESVIHFAGLKAVGESVEQPLKYYNNNLISTLNLCEIMKKHGVKKLIFSSSATVYGKPKSVPIKEDFSVCATNPYGRTKLMIEQILEDVFIADNSFDIILLRYFNPIGADKSCLIGEDPNGIPNNLVPYITQVAIGKLPCLKVFGNDYNTPDGTGIRDYIHVVDLSIGHVKALDRLKDNVGFKVYNLGTGRGYSVLEVLSAFEKVCGKKIPYEIVARRPGDIDICYADTSKAMKELGFKAQYNIDDMCEDSWRWQQMNPNGYKK